ncbi:small ribosomal subunit biogenesis GTPase RsgA [Gammaproteobacteria bacterium LSUCC0057]|uniref:Small ribosomal subunit biogenesis GTPase RsgA n=1 Tax=Gammaproteobacteria bacterium LSUCC0057 TaxID=2559237 RepID=A0A4Y8UF85_9GAMM|nr:small ribosomal subunit biogenesis GTPase RsgA [Gammaproteobacteria bacterium LSUCC0057]
MSKRRLNQQQQRRIDQRQQRSRDQQLDSSAADDYPSSAADSQIGTVIAHFGEQVEVLAADQPALRCHLRANLDQVVVGDRVVFLPGQPTGVIIARQPRDSELIRPDNFGKLKPVAANIDRIGIVIAPYPEPHSNLIDRYLVAAHLQNITPFLLLNKIDLINADNRAEMEQLCQLYSTIGYRVIHCAANTQQGLQPLRDYLAGHTSIFVGQSGVGKSSLLNQLQPGANSSVGELSTGVDKGRHTTTTSRLYSLPGGGSLIDSPGIREFALSHIAPAAVIHGYIDFAPHLQCKFRDCRHQHEPGCALLAAAKSGLIEPQRLTNYRQIVATIENPL